MATKQQIEEKRELASRGLKKCSTCKEIKEAGSANFYKGGSQNDWSSQCKKCKSEQDKKRLEKYRINNPIKSKIKENPSHKICTKCKNDKDISEYLVIGVRSDGSSKYLFTCKSCRALLSTNYRINNRDKINEAGRRRTEVNPEKTRSYCKNYYNANKEKFKIARNKRYYKSDQYRISVLLRGRLRTVLKALKLNKTSSALDLLGCTIEELKIHLESQFTEGMSWEKLGYNGIHIDHKRPCASFDLTDPEQQKICFHYTNLQPLWGPENSTKGSRFEGKRHRYTKKKKE